MRRYATEQLQQQHTLAERSAEKHARFYLQQLVDHREQLKFNNDPTIGRQLLSDIDNIRRAWHWHLERRAVQPLSDALLPLFHLIDIRSRYREGQLLFGELVSCLEKNLTGEHSLLYGRAMARLGWFTFQLGELQRWGANIWVRR